MTNPQVAIDITANDKSGKGIGSADKRFRKLGSDVDKIGGRRGPLGNAARAFAEVEQAAAAAFGNRSVIGTIGKHAGAIGKVGKAFGTGLGRVGSAGAEAAGSLSTTAEAAGAAEAGMGAAAVEAGGLAVAVGAVATVTLGAVAVLGAAAVAGYKFASGWAQGTAEMGRFAETIGVAAADLQKLQGAAERYGIGKDASGGAVASFATTVHDARYGRNNGALALMQRLGVKFRTKADGNLDYDAMLADTSDAIARQKDPQSALLVANRLGVGALLPMLRKGSATVRGEEASFGRDGYVASDKDIATAQGFTRNATILGQMADRAKQGAQAWTAGEMAPVLEKGVAIGRDAIDGSLGSKAASALTAGAEKLGAEISHTFAPAARTIGSAAVKIEGAGVKLLQAAMTFLEGKGWSRDAAAGLVAGFNRESGMKTGAVGDGGHARGIGQWHEDRQALFRQRYGHDIAKGTLAEQLDFSDWELNHNERGAGRRLRGATSAYDAGSIASRFYERPADKAGEADRRGRAADQLVKVEVTHVGAPAGTKTKVTSGAGAQPGVSYAFAQ